MKIWDLPKTEKEAILFFQDKGLLPTTKHCVNGHNTTLYSYEKENFWKCNNSPCLKKSIWDIYLRIKGGALYQIPNLT